MVIRTLESLNATVPICRGRVEIPSQGNHSWGQIYLEVMNGSTRRRDTLFDKNHGGDYNPSHRVKTLGESSFAGPH